MRLKIVENYDSSFVLDSEAERDLHQQLKDETFRQQIGQNAQGKEIQFTGLLFKPVPYSLNTPKGMPPEFEQYHDSEDYVIINVPPQFMFKARIFQPNRLCAVYRINQSTQ